MEMGSSDLTFAPGDLGTAPDSLGLDLDQSGLTRMTQMELTRRSDLFTKPSARAEVERPKACRPLRIV